MSDKTKILLVGAGAVAVAAYFLLRNKNAVVVINPAASGAGGTTTGGGNVPVNGGSTPVVPAPVNSIAVGEPIQMVNSSNQVVATIPPIVNNNTTGVQSVIPTSVPVPVIGTCPAPMLTHVVYEPNSAMVIVAWSNPVNNNYVAVTVETSVDQQTWIRNTAGFISPRRIPNDSAVGTKLQNGAMVRNFGSDVKLFVRIKGHCSNNLESTYSSILSTVLPNPYV